MKKINPKKISYSSKTLVVFMLVVLLVSICLTLLWANTIFKKSDSTPLEVKILPYDFKVTSDYGMVLDSDMLHFGEAPPKSTLSRKINLTAEQDVRVEIFWSGDGNMSVNETDFMLLAGDLKTLKFYLYIPENLTLGTYTGIVYFHFYKV